MLRGRAAMTATTMVEVGRDGRARGTPLAAKRTAEMTVGGAGGMTVATAEAAGGQAALWTGGETAAALIMVVVAAGVLLR
jgi:hypothetical protein